MDLDEIIDALLYFHRVPEIIFQPTMVGVDQCGISDTIEFILQYYPPDVQQRLVDVSTTVIMMLSAQLTILLCVTGGQRKST